MKANLKPSPAPEGNSRRMLESILAQEEEHAEDLVDLLEDLPKV